MSSQAQPSDDIVSAFEVVNSPREKIEHISAEALPPHVYFKVSCLLDSMTQCQIPKKKSKFVKFRQIPKNSKKSKLRIIRIKYIKKRSNFDVYSTWPLLTFFEF